MQFQRAHCEAINRILEENSENVLNLWTIVLLLKEKPQGIKIQVNRIKFETLKFPRSLY